MIHHRKRKEFARNAECKKEKKSKYKVFSWNIFKKFFDFNQIEVIFLHRFLFLIQYVLVKSDVHQKKKVFLLMLQIAGESFVIVLLFGKFQVYMEDFWYIFLLRDTSIKLPLHWFLHTQKVLFQKSLITL